MKHTMKRFLALTMALLLAIPNSVFAEEAVIVEDSIGTNEIASSILNTDFDSVFTDENNQNEEEDESILADVNLSEWDEPNYEKDASLSINDDPLIVDEEIMESLETSANELSSMDDHLFDDNQNLIDFGEDIDFSEEFLTEGALEDQLISEEAAETEGSGELGEDAFVEEAAKEILPFDQFSIVDGVRITVQADPGAFPEGAILSVKPILPKQIQAADAAVEEVRDDEQNVAVSYVFDIKVIDSQTNLEIQPADGFDVRVSFDLSEAADENLEAYVYHITGSGNNMSAQKLEDVEIEDETVTAVTDGFSLYTVEFTYNDLEYVLPGDTSVAMSEILATLNLTGEVTAVQVSNSELFTALQTNSGWVVNAVQAFSTTEWMRVTINDIEFLITVTDDINDSIIKGVAYIDESGNTETKDAIVITANSTTWEGNNQKNGWYVVNSPVEIAERITVEGDVHLILENAIKLTATSGISVTSGNSLTIYAQSTTYGMGYLDVKGYDDPDNDNDDGTGIGGNGAKITINGGNITAIGDNGVGIGGEGAVITINGGIVNASGDAAAGIGYSGDSTATGTTVTINGSAQVKARGSSGKAGIGNSGSSDDVELIVGQGLYVYEIYFSGSTEKKKPIDKIDGDYKRTEYMAVNSTIPALAAELTTAGASTAPFYNDDTAISQWVNKGGKLKLYRDIKLVNGIEDVVLFGNDFILDFNGWGLIYQKTATSPVITIQSGTLQLEDSNTTKKHNYSLSAESFASVGSGSKSFYGGYITGGKASGVCVGANGEFIMPVGTIIGNTNTGNYGGGVVLSDEKATFMMSGGKITGNKADLGRGSGVYLDKGIFNMSGSPVIIENAASNVYLVGGKSIIINGELTEGASVGVTMQTNGEESDFTKNYNYGNNGAPSAYFSSDATGLKVLRNVESDQAKLGVHEHKFRCELEEKEDGDVLVIYCENNDCGHEGETKQQLTFTIPDPYVYGDNVAPADFLDSKALTAFNEAYNEAANRTISPENNIVYYILNENGEYSRLDAQPTDAGNYKAELQVEPIDGTEMTETIKLTQAYTISKKTLTITGISVDDKEYDGEVDAVITTPNSLTLEGVLTADVNQVNITGSPKAVFSDANAGTRKTVTISGYDLDGPKAKNYYLEQPQGIVANIVPKTINLTWENTSLTYNGTTQAPKAVPAANNILGNDECVVTVTGYQKNASSNSYTATATSLSNSNYALPTDPEKVTTAFTIAPKTVGLSWTNTSLVYNGQDLKPTASATGLISNDKCMVTVIGEAKDAGSHTATADQLSNTNYCLPSASERTQSFMISPKSVKLTWENTSFIYDGDPHTPTAKVKDGYLVTGDTCTVTVTGSGTEVGTYTATATDLSNKNYALPSEVTHSFSIGKVVAELEWGKTSFDYDGQIHVPKVTVKNLEAGDTCEVTVTGSSAEAGDHTAKATALSNQNYLLPSNTDAKTKLYTINPKTVGLEWGNDSFTYDGSNHVPTATATNLIIGDSCSVTVSGEKKNYGSYTATATKLSNKNYALPQAVTKAYTINQRIADLTWSNTSLTYNGQERQPTVKVKNLVSGDTCTVTLSVDRKAKDVGNYTATAILLSNSNYTLSTDPEKVSKGFEIGKKTVGLSWGSALFVYDGENHAPTATATDVISGDTCDVMVTGAAKNAGTHTAKASELSNSNYQLPASVTKTFKIDKKTVGLSWGNASFSYDGQDHLPTATATGLITGDTCTVTVGDAKKNAGSYTATATALSNANYALPTANTKEFSIAKKPVDIEWGNASFTYDRKSHAPTATATGLITGDVCTVTVGGAQINAGNYTATASSLSNANYALPSENEKLTKAFTIERKTVGITWKNTSLTYNKQSQQPTVTLSGVISGDTCTPTITGSAIIPGGYTATVSKLSNDNYALPATNTQSSFSISPKTVGLNWTNTSLMYNGKQQQPTVTLTGVIDGDTCEVTVSGAEKDAGSYTATAGNLTNTNYVLPASNTKAFTIAKMEVGLEWGNDSFNYDGQSHAPTATATGLIQGDTCDVTVTGNQKNAGNYTATASAVSNKNYVLPKSNKKAFTIIPKTVGISWSDTSLVYNGKAQKPVANATGLISGDSCTVTVSGAQKDVGKYTASADKLSSANYVLPDAVKQEFTISQKTVGLNWKKTSLTYNKKEQQPTVTLTGVASGDTCTVTMTGAATNAGTYTAEVTALSNANYALPAVTTQTFSINPITVGLKWGNTSFTYDEQSHVPSATAIGLIDGDTCEVTVSGAAVNVGSYTAKATGLSNDNYALSGTPTKAFKIVAGSNTGSSGKQSSTGTANNQSSSGTTGEKPSSSSTGQAVTEYLTIPSPANYNPEGTLMAKLVSTGKTSLKLTWTKMENITGYDVFFNRGEKSYPLNFANSIGAGQTLSLTFEGLIKGTSYKALVRAYVESGGQKSYVRDSQIVYAFTDKGNNTVSNTSKVTVKKKSYKLKKGKTAKISAKAVLVNKKKNNTKLCATVRYISSDKSVATVSKNGKIKAKKKGNCTIYCVAANGAYKKVKVKVN